MLNFYIYSRAVGYLMYCCNQERFRNFVHPPRESSEGILGVSLLLGKKTVPAPWTVCLAVSCHNGSSYLSLFKKLNTSVLGVLHTYLCGTCVSTQFCPSALIVYSPGTSLSFSSWYSSLLSWFTVNSLFKPPKEVSVTVVPTSEL